MFVRFKIPGYWLAIKADLRIRLKKREGTPVLAICNKVRENYCVFLDYDYDNEKTLIRELQGLQEQYGLGTAYLFKTGRGVHVIFADAMSYADCRTVIMASSCDDHYKEVPQRNNSRVWALRATSKKNNNHVLFYKVLPAPTNKKPLHPILEYLERAGVPSEIIRPLYKNSLHRQEKLLYATYEA